MKTMLACCVVSGCLLLSGAAGAETKLTRSRALALARQQNPQVAASRAGQVEAEALKGQADAARWPQLELDVASGPAEKAALVPGTAIQSTRSAYDFTWSDLSVVIGGRGQLIQPIYTFGKIDRRRAAAAHGIRAAAAQTQMTQADVCLEVARLYEGFLFAHDAELVFQEAMRIANNSIDQAKERRQEGSSNFNENDLLRLQLARTVVKLALEQSRTGMAEARAGLTAYLGLQPGEPISFTEDSLEPISRVSPDLDGLIALALQHRPEVRALTEGAAAYGELARAEHAGYFPDFFALGQITAAYTPGRDLVTSRYYVDPFYGYLPAVLIGARWTLQANMPGQRAKEMNAKAKRYQELLHWAQVGIPAEVKVAHDDAMRAQKDYDETTTALPWAKQWMVRASADYAAGLGTARELTDAVTAYMTMRTARMEAVMRLNVALASLGKATGTLVEASGPYPGDARTSSGAGGR